MKNIISAPGSQLCHDCLKPGLFCYTPQGADYCTCPCCGTHDFDCELFGDTQRTSPQYAEFHDLLDEGEYKDDANTQLDLHLCHKCLILYDVGCTHSKNGCTSDIYNGHLIANYEWRGVTYEGMPQFDSLGEWRQEMPHLNVLKLTCPNSVQSAPNICHCAGRSYYPKCKYPYWYTQCELINKFG